MTSKLDEKEMTFAPKINNRPAFLGPQKPLNKIPAYKLAFSYSNDPMEKPLPGKSSYQPEPEPALDSRLDMHDRQYSLVGQITAPLTPATPTTYYSSNNDSNNLPFLPTHDTVGGSTTSGSAPKSRLSLLKSKLRQAESSTSQKVSSMDRDGAIDISSAFLSKGSYPYQSSPALLPSRSDAISAANMAVVTPPMSGGRLLVRPRRSSPASSLVSAQGQDQNQDQNQRRGSIPSTEYFLSQGGAVSSINTPVKQLFSSSVSSSPVDTIINQVTTALSLNSKDKNIFDHIDSAGFSNDYSQLSECVDCGRKFNPTAYEKHVKVCKKVFQSQRKIFDSKNMRIHDNPELVKILTQKEREEGKGKGKGKSKNAEGRSVLLKNTTLSSINSSNQDTHHHHHRGGIVVGGQQQQPKWKADSELFRQMMKNARDTSKAMAEGRPLPPPVMSAPDPSLVPCPHCGRNFNEKAAERHIPLCVNIRARPTSLRRGDGKNGLAGAASVSTSRINRKLY